MKVSTQYLIGLTALFTLTLFIQSWHIPHVLAAIGVLAVAAKSINWDWHHYLTMLGALLLAGIPIWLKYGGPDFRIDDTPILGLLLLVLRAMYQTPPAVKT